MSKRSTETRNLKHFKHPIYNELCFIDAKHGCVLSLIVLLITSNSFVLKVFDNVYKLNRIVVFQTNITHKFLPNAYVMKLKIQKRLEIIRK